MHSVILHRSHQLDCDQLTMGVFLIFYATQGGRIGRFLNLFYGNLVIPEIVLAVALLGFFSLISIPLGLITLTLAHSLLGLGFVIPILYARFLELDLRYDGSTASPRSLSHSNIF